MAVLGCSIRGNGEVREAEGWWGETEVPPGCVGCHLSLPTAELGVSELSRVETLLTFLICSPSGQHHGCGNARGIPGNSVARLLWGEGESCECKRM